MMRVWYCVLVTLLGFFNVTLIGSFILCEKATSRSLFLRIVWGGVMCCEPWEIFYLTDGEAHFMNICKNGDGWIKRCVYS